MGSDWEWGKENGLWGDDGMPYGIDSPAWTADWPDDREDDRGNGCSDDGKQYRYRANIFQNLQEAREYALKYNDSDVFVRNPIGSGFILKDEKSILLNCAKDEARTKQWYFDIIQELSPGKDSSNIILDIETENKDIESEDYFCKTFYICKSDLFIVNDLIEDFYVKLPNLIVKFRDIKK